MMNIILPACLSFKLYALYLSVSLSVCLIDCINVTESMQKQYEYMNERINECVILYCPQKTGQRLNHRQ